MTYSSSTGTSSGARSAAPSAPGSGPATSCRRDRAPRPRRVGRGGARDEVGRRAGLLHPADVLPGRLALREAGLRRDGRARGAARRPLRPRRAAGAPRALLRRLGLRVGEPGRSGHGGRGEGRRLHDDRAPRSGSSASRTPCFLATACLLLVVLAAKVAARRPLAAPHAAVGAPLQRLVVVDLLEHRPARRLRDPGAPLGAVPLLRVAPPERARRASARARPGSRPPPATRLAILAASALGLGWLLFHGAPSALDDLLVSRRQRLSALSGGSALGPTPYFAALYTFVNIHHFFMDSVIWRRDNPETRYLLARD